MSKEKISETNLTKILKKIILGGVLLSLFTPLIVKQEAYFPFISPRSIFFMAMAQIVFFTWLFLISYNKNYRPKLNPVTLILLLFIISLIFSTVLSVDPSTSFWSNHERMMGLLIHFHLFAFFLAVSSTFKNEKKWIKILGFSCFVATIVSLIGMADNSGIISFAIDLSRGSTLGNTSFMGSYLLINVFLALYVFKKEEGGWKTFHGINLLIISLGVALNPGGRAMKGGLLIGLIVFFLLYLAFINRHKTIKILSKTALLAGIVFFIFFSLMAFQEGSIVREKIMGLQGMTGRFAVWEKAWQGFVEKPFLGWGLENFDVVFMKNFNPQMFLESHGREVWFDRAHNIVFDSLVTTGIIGTLLFFGIFATALLSLWKKYLKEKEIGFLAPFVFSSLFVGYFIQNLTVFDTISSYMLIFLSLSFIASLCWQKQEQENEKPFNYLAIIILIPFIFSYSLFVYQPYKSNSFVFASFRTNKTSQEKMLFSEQAVKASPLGVGQIRGHIAERFLNRYQSEIQEIENLIQRSGTMKEKNELEVKLKEKKEIINEKFEFARNELNKSINEAPVYFKYFLLMGRLYNSYFNFYYLERLIEIQTESISSFSEEEEKFFTEAENWVGETQEYLQKAIDSSPSNQQGYEHYAQSIINKGKIEILRGNDEKSKEKFEEAYVMVKKIIDLEPNLFQSHLMAIIIARDLLRDKDLTNEIIERAVDIDSSWEELLETYKQ